MYPLQSQRPLGMQIHAVPEAERAVDNNGRKLPWGYDYGAPAGMNDIADRPPIEKGPFGRSMRRSRSGKSRSRSKTAEPRREEDKIRAENMAAEDMIFGSMRRTGAKDGAEGKSNILGEVDPNAISAQPANRADGDSEPTEVLLYGFGEELQSAAIDFYERVSNGLILEDYERQAPGQKYDISRSLGRQQAQKSLSRAAMRKKNRYAGGEHWIKVTFDSSQAAELATARSPHIIRGYLVYAEPYLGRGPQKDEPVFATQAGAQITSDALPITFSTTQAINGSPNGSSTVSSATATASAAPSNQQRLALNSPIRDSPTSSSSTMTGGFAPHNQATAPTSQATGFQTQQQAAPDSQSQPRRLRIEGATRAVLLPAELAMAPKAPKVSWSSWIGASDIIGSAVPRKEDGSFYWDRASSYWRLFWWIDRLLGTDFCGLKIDE